MTLIGEIVTTNARGSISPTTTFTLELPSDPCGRSYLVQARRPSAGVPSISRRQAWRAILRHFGATPHEALSVD
jgi:hypothetical protein